VKHLAQPTLKKGMCENKRALSPVVASIILIAVTVAVSIATAAWMGALTFNFMGTKSMEIIGTRCMGISGDPNNSILVRIENTGTGNVTLSSVKINDITKNFNGTEINFVPNQRVVIEIYNVQWQTNYKITIKVISTQNNEASIEITPF
jgi:flagellin-like protein